jgi:hypothetical protein
MEPLEKSLLHILVSDGEKNFLKANFGTNKVSVEALCENIS